MTDVNLDLVGKKIAAHRAGNNFFFPLNVLWHCSDGVRAASVFWRKALTDQTQGPFTHYLVVT